MFEVDNSYHIEAESEDHPFRELVDASNMLIEVPPLSRTIKYFVESSGRMKSSIADAIGVSGATLTMWCQGKRTPSRSNLKALADVLGINVIDFYLFQNDPESDSFRDDYRPLVVNTSKLAASMPSVLAEKMNQAIVNDEYSKTANNSMDLRQIQINTIEYYLHKMKDDELDKVESLCKELLRRR